MQVLRPILRPRFDVMARLGRRADPAALSDEVGWYESFDGALAAVMSVDANSKYSVSLLGRDLAGRFRTAHSTAAFNTPGNALLAANLFACAANAGGTSVFEQGDEGRPVDLFAHVVAPHKLHERFTLLDTGEHFAAARAVVVHSMPWIENQDGNFVQQFQSDGFDARIWELYLFLVLRETGHQVSNPRPAPDFLASSSKGSFLVEATTANPVQPGSEPERPTSKEEADRLVENFVVSRYSNALLAKLRKRYWELPHAIGLPLTIAVQDFHSSLSMTYSGNALQIYLYGHTIDQDEQGTRTARKINDHRWGSKVFPSGYFFQPEAENISAVLFNGAGTIAKFNRIGVGGGFGSPNVTLLHSGRRLDPDDASGGVSFSNPIEDGYEESWVDGLNVFHNPRAVRPLNPDLLPGAAHHFWDGTNFVVYFPRGHLESSITHNIRKVSGPPHE